MSFESSKPTLDVPRNRDASPGSSPLERRATSSTLSSTAIAYSVASSVMAESSAMGSNRNSNITSDNEPGHIATATSLNSSNQPNNRRSHRSHRSRHSGAFLLSGPEINQPLENAALENSKLDKKGKIAVKSQPRKHTRRGSGIGLGIGGSPLATHVVHAGAADAVNGNAARGGDTTTPIGLDVESAHMVNLALNLSENRRNASRRYASTPVPSLATTFGEGFAGGSLRQHLQQQRRASRNVSPKPQRASTASPRGIPGQLPSPLHATFEEKSNEKYEYHFSASTLARAEKAKTQIELMAQYRRLLEYVPPLKPENIAPPGSPSMSRAAAIQQGSFGRPYNPLQYIRNRKVRARERKAIDGEAQGFGDLEQVNTWVDEISKKVSTGQNQAIDCMAMPIFSKAAETAASPHHSPLPVIGKSPTAKIKRPRIDWDTNPADMLADLFWVHQHNNRHVVEDRHGRKIFPPSLESQRPMSRKGEDLEVQKPPEGKKVVSPDLRIDTKLPEFKTMKTETDKHASTTSKVRHRIRDATRIHHSGGRESRQFLQGHGKSESDTSDTDSARHSRQRRSGSAEAHDFGVDILNKQMLELLAKEARENGNTWGSPQSKDGHDMPQSSQPHKPFHTDNEPRSRTSLDDRSTSGSIVARKGTHHKRHSMVNSSGRASLEVPGTNPRTSLDFSDSTAPNSPLAQPTKASPFAPSIAMDLSPPQRQTSPTRNPLSKVASKINPFEHARSHSRGRPTVAPEASGALNTVDVATENLNVREKRQRSESPDKKVSSKPTSRRGSLRRGKTSEDTSGIRGLFKGRRGPVATVSDFIWKRDSGSGTPTAYSTDESDIDDTRIDTGRRNGSRDSSAGPARERHGSPREKTYDLPIFASQSDRHGSGDHEHRSKTRGDQEMRAETSRGNHLDTPRIDVHRPSPGTSPETPESEIRGRSSLPEFERRRDSEGVLRADARLNNILGLSGVDAAFKRPSLEGQRQWSISDRGVSVHRGPMTKREIARIRALLLSSGIKAKEISRRAAEPQCLYNTQVYSYKGIADLAPEKLEPVPKRQQHIVVARILSDNIQLSNRVWQESADKFCNTTVQDLVYRIEDLKGTIQENLTPMAREAADEADEVSKDLVSSQTLKVKDITDKMDMMLRRRRRRFRWLRRAGWVLVEWSLVGVMWFVWLTVIIVRIFMGIGNGMKGAVRWLLWL
ncbi:hypothetical protein B0O99DRAFT_618737 [Bisporella sp. PMI_857]|nr:hypothetical protein B0O99DRAFT_618737 [Bisporella sp. PMI_857]